MKSLQGTISKNDLEGGFWELVTDQGTRYTLQGADDSLLIDGMKVCVQGEVKNGAFGIGMVGNASLHVGSWTPSSDGDVSKKSNLETSHQTSKSSDES